MVAVEWGAATTVGTVRPHNEDSHLAVETLFVVADGMGGHKAGEVASRLAVETFAPWGGRVDLAGDEVREALLRANGAIRAAAGADPARAGMGTTIVGLTLVRDAGHEYWMTFSVGDSRLYRYFGGRLERRTVDHTEAQELVAAGVLSDAQGALHPGRHVLTRALGTEPAPTADCYLSCPVPGERFLLCSDGLTGALDDTRLAEELAVGDGSGAVADRLVAAALAAGVRDNATVIVVDVLGADPALPGAVNDDTTPRNGRGATG